MSERFRAGAGEGAGRHRRGASDRHPEPRRGLPAVSRRACCAGSMSMIVATERGDTRPDPAGYASADALVGRSQADRDRADRARQRPEIAGNDRAAGPAGSRVVPLQHRAARCPGEHDQAQRGPGRPVARTRPEAAATPPDPGSDDVARSGSPRSWRVRSPPGRGAAGAAAGVGRDAGHVPPGAAAARGDRSRGVRGFRAQHDPKRERRARRVPARQDRPASSPTPPGIESCTLPDRAALRDHRGPAARPRHHARAAGSAAGPPQRASAGRSAGGDDRVLRLEQGRRVPHLQLGAVQGADQAHPAGQGDRGADRLLPWARRIGEPGRRADRPRDRRPARRARSRAGCGSRSRERWSRSSTPTAARRSTRSSCSRRASSSTRSSRSGRRRWCRRPSSTRRWRRSRARRRRHTAG